MTDFSALCAELAAIVAEEYGHTNEYRHGRPLDVSEVSGLLTRARAALDQPEAEGPTDEELHRLWLDLYAFHDGPTSGEVAEIARAVLARWGSLGIERCHRLQQENHRFREPERTILCDILANGTLLPDPDGRRYGRSTAEPTPVNGQPPCEEECDAEHFG